MRSDRGQAAAMFVIGVMLCVPSTIWAIARWWTDFTATRDCLAYVDRAAHAPTLDVAENALQTAIRAAEDRRWTSGNTGVVWTQTTNDVGFWFEQVKNCLADVQAARKEGTQLAASNVLMRVREALSRQPDSLAFHPHNGAWVFTGWIVWPVALIGGFIAIVGLMVLIEG